MREPVARARWRRCFAFSLALSLLARIVVLALTVFFTRYSNLDGFRPFYREAPSGCHHPAPQSTPTGKGPRAQRPPTASAKISAADRFRWLCRRGRPVGGSAPTITVQTDQKVCSRPNVDARKRYLTRLQYPLVALLSDRRNHSLKSGQ
jgi:hypothetical protein